MRCSVLVALSVIALASEAPAGGFDTAPLRGSAVYAAAPSYPVDVLPQPYLDDGAVLGYPEAGPRFYPVPPAQDLSKLPFRLEVGGRYWMSFGKLAKNLFDIPTSSAGMVSRLTYTGLTAHSGEAFARLDHPLGVLIKGYAGLANFSKGSLNDEDFTPFIDPYSSTLSRQRGGHFRYGTADVGYTAWQIPWSSLSAFVGYNYLGEKANAFGCTQIATNPFVCVPTIPNDVLGITENTQWHALRLGVLAEVTLLNCLKLSGEAAWVPYANVTGGDIHWLRLGSTIGSFSGPIPESGHGHGVQLEALLSYQASQRLSVGVGARYWHMQTKGTADFTNVVVGIPASPQPLDFSTDRYGVFVQGAYRL